MGDVFKKSEILVMDSIDCSKRIRSKLTPWRTFLTNLRFDRVICLQKILLVVSSDSGGSRFGEDLFATIQSNARQKAESKEVANRHHDASGKTAKASQIMA